jgi:hypothetical protein
LPATKGARDLATAKGLNVTNAVCELSRWRKFNGLARTNEMKPRKAKEVEGTGESCTARDARGRLATTLKNRFASSRPNGK